MQQTALVKKIIKNGHALIEVTRPTACGGNCVSCGGLCGRGVKVESVAENPIGAKQGDTVMVETESRQIIKAALLVYAVPLVLLIIGYTAASVLGAEEKIAVLSAFIGFAVGFAVVFGINKYLRREKGVCVRIIGII